MRHHFDIADGVEEDDIFNKKTKKDRASWMSFDWMVTCLAWIAHRLVSSKRGLGTPSGLLFGVGFRLVLAGRSSLSYLN